MSRKEFRAEVVQARPRSAWLLALVGSGMLWITQHLAAWTVALQICALILSYVTRTRPRPLQSSPLALNTGMVCIALATVAMALRHTPATIALAHFAALSQALQLLDARPRKSEFLFVTLALFQVILAANLTDSVWFPPLLVAFLISATWTLIIHTLRSEAREAYQWDAIRDTRPPGLMRMTAVASAASLMVAIVLFVTLPRFRSSMLQTGIGARIAVSGFSDKVELGAFGKIRADHRVVLRVETLEGTPPRRVEGYWRGLAFDTFDGRSWSISPISETQQRRTLAGSPRFGLDLLAGPRNGMLVQRIVREPVEAGVLFGAGMARRIEGPFDRLERDANDGLSNPRQVNERIRYTLWTRGQHPNDASLSRDEVSLPLPRGPTRRTEDLRYLALPDLDPQIQELAERIVGDAPTDAERARAIETHLRNHGRYTDEPPPMGDEIGRSPIEDFLLGDLAGHCEYFASAMVVLSRSAGLPSRLVNGFAGGRTNELGGFTELSAADAHAWVEIHYRNAGWVRYDPTPPDLRMREVGDPSIAASLMEVASAIELWWFQRVVDFDSSDQILALKAAWTSWRSLRSPGPRPIEVRSARRKPWSTAATLPTAWILSGVLALGAGAVLLGLRRVRTRGRPPVPHAYAGALRLLAKRGLVRGPSITAREFSRQVSATLEPQTGLAFEHLTEWYLALRFGEISGPGADQALAKLRRGLANRA
jgi:transglutaminase-like putative cysteine protease